MAITAWETLASAVEVVDLKPIEVTLTAAAAALPGVGQLFPNPTMLR